MQEADAACEAVTTEELLHNADGALNWTTIQQEFADMNQALLEFSPISAR